MAGTIHYMYIKYNIDGKTLTCSYEREKERQSVAPTAM
jgi:hypothetical protein